AALASLREHAPDAATFARAIGLSDALATTVYERVIEKLGREPVEDHRLDFEDGYGNRSDDEEDGHAVSAAAEVAAGLAARSLPPFIGIRIKPLTEELRVRSLRTLDHFVSALLDKTGGTLPANFAVTLPKVTTPEQVTALISTLEALERRHALAEGSLVIELM